MGEPEILAGEAQHDKFAGLEASADEMEISVGLGGVVKAVAADEVGAELVEAAPVFADMELKVELAVRWGRP